MGNCCSLARKQCCWCAKRAKRKVVLLLLGLDNAGKTSTAKTLIGEGGCDVVPTVGFATSTLSHRRCSVTMLDVGGGAGIRGIWPRYFARAHAVVYVVDAADEPRLAEAAAALVEALEHPQLAGKPLLLLATKQDATGALDEIDVSTALELEALVNRQRCPTLLETCSTGQRQADPALVHGYKWLVGSVMSDWDALDARVTSDCAAQRADDEVARAQRASRVAKLRAARGDDVTDDVAVDDVEGGDPWRPVGDLARAKSSGSANARVILVQESPSRQRTVTVDPEPDPVPEPEPQRELPDVLKPRRNGAKANVSSMVRTSKIFQVKKPAHARAQSQANVIPERAGADEAGRSRPGSAAGGGAVSGSGVDDRPMSAGAADARPGSPQSKVAMKEYVKDQLGLVVKQRNRLALRRNNKTAPAPAQSDKPGRSPRPARRADASAILSVVQGSPSGGSGVTRLPPLRAQPWARTAQTPLRPDSAGSPSNWELERPLDTIVMTYDMVDSVEDDVVVAGTS